MKKSQAAKLYWFNYTAKRRFYFPTKKKTLMDTIKTKVSNMKNYFRGSK